jgi:hypothetical protein
MLKYQYDVELRQYNIARIWKKIAGLKEYDQYIFCSFLMNGVASRKFVSMQKCWKKPQSYQYILMHIDENVC